MAIRSINGLDTLTQVGDFLSSRGGGSDFSSFVGTPVLQPTGGVVGGGAMQFPSGVYARTSSENLYTHEGLFGWFKMPTSVSQMWLFHKREGTSRSNGGFRVETDGSIKIYGRMDALVSTLFPPGSIIADKWYYFALHFHSSNLTQCHFRLNGVVVTAPTSNYNEFNAAVRIFEGGDVVVDDVCITSHDPSAMDPQLIYTLSPNADSTPQDMSVVGAASAWEAISEKVHDGDTSYITSGNVGNKSAFTLQDLPAGVTSITGVQGYVVASREGSGGTNNVRASVKKSDDSTLVTADVTLQDSTYISASIGKSESALTPADVNGMKVEFEVIA